MTDDAGRAVVPKFIEEIRKVVDYFTDEFNLSYAEAVGSLELIKSDIVESSRHLHDDDDDDDDDDLDLVDSDLDFPDDHLGESGFDFDDEDDDLDP